MKCVMEISEGREHIELIYILEGVSRPSMSAYVLSFLDSMRQRTCFLGH